MTKTKRIPAKLGFGALLTLAAVLAVFAVGCPAAQSSSTENGNKAGGDGNGEEKPLDGVPIRVAIPEDYVVDPGDDVVVTVHLKGPADYTAGQVVLITPSIQQDPAPASGQDPLLPGTGNRHVLRSAIVPDVTIGKNGIIGTFKIETNPNYGQGALDGANATIQLQLQALRSNGDPKGRKYFTSVTVHRPG